MRVSVITVCYNSEKTIERTIRSVLAQKDVDLEYIIKDGGSADSTVDIIRKYAETDGRIKYVSGPDGGIYDAMNAGIAAAGGDVIGILNSDDWYAAESVLLLVAAALSDETLDSCYGNLLYVKDGKPYRYWKSGRPRTFRFGWMPPHPAFFVKKSVYERFGLFRPDCGVNADYELMLRFLHRERISSRWLDRTIVFMEAGGASNNGINARVKAVKNDALAWKVNGLKLPFYTIFLKRLRKIGQFYVRNVKTENTA